MKISILDTTLRDGTQGEAVSFTVEDKLMIAQKLDELGIDYVEGGWPGSNPKDAEFFRRAHELKLQHTRLTAFGSTRLAKNPCIRTVASLRSPWQALPSFRSLERPGTFTSNPRSAFPSTRTSSSFP